MLKEMFEYVVGLGPAKLLVNDDHGDLFDKEVFRPPAPPKEPRATALVVSSLTAFVGFVAENIDLLHLPQNVIHVADPCTVRLLSAVGGYYRDRETIIVAKVERPSLLETWHPLENLVVGLMSQFDGAGHRDAMLEFLKSVSKEGAEIRNDDGVSQAVNVKQGIKTLGVGVTKNPYLLAPFRTFAEVAQPISSVILRLRDTGQIEAALKEADGGAWKLAAMEAVAEFLRDRIGILEDPEKMPKVIW
jgi:hypothetical protein